jgi:hypothetical protein
MRHLYAFLLAPRRGTPRGWGVAILLALALSACDSKTTAEADAAPVASSAGLCQDDTALDLYERKIAPLFSDDQPSTCNQCHLPGVDLGLFARGTACETLACLLDQGLADPTDPANSKILTWIGSATPDSQLITEQVIADEHAAFEQWLTYSLECNTCADARCPGPDGGAACELADEPASGFDPVASDPGGCERPALEAVFRETVYSERGRCSPCHFDDHEEEDTPAWISVSFDCQESSVRTYNNVVDHGYINREQPDESLLLLKPLGIVKHGGGQKFEGTDDESYRRFKYFIDRWTACQ